MRSNVATVRALAPGQLLIASTKANAYGHGAATVAAVLEEAGVDALWTGSYAEAVAARAAGVRLPILMFGAAPSARDRTTALSRAIALTVTRSPRRSQT